MLELIEEIEETLEVEREVESEKQANDRDRSNGNGNSNHGNGNHGNGNRGNGNRDNANGNSNGNRGDKGDGNSNTPKNMCSKPGHNHEWKNCPENWNSKNYRGKDGDDKNRSSRGGGGRDKRGGENHSIDKTKESAPVVKFAGDFTFESDDESCEVSIASGGEHYMIASSKPNDLHPVTLISMQTSKGEMIASTVLLDQCFTGGLLITSELASQLGLKMTECASNNSYTTATGVLKTTKQVKVDNIKLPCLSKTRRFKGVFEVIPKGASSTPYGVFLGSAKMRELDIDTSLRNNSITWGEDIAIPMVQRGHWTADRINARLRSLAQKRPQVKEAIKEATEEAQPRPQPQVKFVDDVNTNNSASQVSSTMEESSELNLVDALQLTNYTKPDLTKMLEQEKYNHLNAQQKLQLLEVLQKNEKAFEGKRGNYTGGEASIHLKPNAVPFWGQPYPIPLKNREVTELEVRRQCQIGALRQLSAEEIEDREWACPAFGVAKSNGSIRLVMDFRKLNDQLERKQTPLSTIEEMITSINGFLYASVLDLNMGYLSIPLCEKSRKMLNIVMPFGYFECQVLPMGVKPATDIFQTRMVSIFMSMNPLTKPDPYIDDILHSKGKSFCEHLNILAEILRRLVEAGMQVNGEKSDFCAIIVKFVGFCLSQTGYRPVQSRVEAILKIMAPTNIRQVRGFLGTVNFIKNHIRQRAAIMQPITELTKKDVRFRWTNLEQEAFDTIKARVAESVMLSYPDISKPFDLYPDANNDHAMGAMLCQGDNTISTFSRKFNEAQLKYNITEKELLAAYEACKYFHGIIHGCNITIHSDHMNLMYDDARHVNGRVLRQRIALDQEYNAKIVHIAGPENTGADGLSRLPMFDETPALSQLTQLDEVPAAVTEQLWAINNISQEEIDMFPMNMFHIKAEQDKDEYLQAKLLDSKYKSNFGKQTYDEIDVITFNGLVWLPPTLQASIITWYHENLQHAGVTRTINFNINATLVFLSILIL